MAALPTSFSSIKPSKTVGAINQLRIIASRQLPTRKPAPRTASLFTLPKEPEDAGLTGGTRSLDRRLLALNLSGTRY